MKKILSLVLFVMIPLLSSAQNGAEDKPEIRVRAEVHKDKIMLRWIPSTTKAWNLLNKYGYSLERITVTRSGKVLEKHETKVLATKLIPQMTDKVKELANKYDMAAVMAQAVFGDDFEVGFIGRDDISRAVNLTQMREQRFILSLYAADQCFPMAKEIGWGWEDTQAKQGERYLYRVKSLVPEKLLKIEHGAVYVDPAEFTLFPKPLELNSIFSDESVLLTWNYSLLSHLYSVYWVERSDDGVNFKRITNTPVTRMGENQDVNTPIDYMDSIKNDRKYYYRVAGVTPFGTVGPYSDVVSGMGYMRLSKAPHITESREDKDNSGILQWEFDKKMESILRDFQILHSENDKNYTVLDSVDRSARIYHIKKLGDNKYYRIRARSLHGENVSSYSVMIQTIDSIPPAVPTGLQGQIDSLGVARIHWNRNTDEDILGYRLFRAYAKNDELTPLNDLEITDTCYVDTVDMRMLNKQVFYAVAALDKRYNMSQLSPAQVVIRPRKIAPSVPLISSIKPYPGKNVITWVTGKEDYIGGFTIERKHSSDSAYCVVKKIVAPKMLTYEDTLGIKPNSDYEYRISAYSVDGVSSSFSPAYSVHTNLAKSGSKNIVKFNAKRSGKDVRLSVEYLVDDIESVKLYKQINGKYLLIDSDFYNNKELFDKKIKDADRANYMLLIKRRNYTPIKIEKTVKL